MCLDKKICRCFVFGEIWGHLRTSEERSCGICLLMSLPKLIQKYKVVMGWSLTQTLRYSVLTEVILYFFCI